MSEATHPILSCSVSKNVSNVHNVHNEQAMHDEQRQEQPVIAVASSQQSTSDSQQQPARIPGNVQELETFDTKYGAEHVIKLFIPVSLCMLVVVLTINTITFYTTKDIYLVYTPFHEASSDTFTKTWNAVANSLILIALVITMTVLLIILYKARCYKLIHGWLIFSTLMLLFLFALLFFEEVLRSYNTPVDIFTVLLFNWNFGVAGMVCIHWKGPLRVQQGYLIFVAALMALVFIKYLPEWTTWMMLFVISVWDVVAVLSPRGPLKVLVETAQERNETIFPSLIYSATAYIVNITNADEIDETSSSAQERSQRQRDVHSVESESNPRSSGTTRTNAARNIETNETFKNSTRNEDGRNSVRSEILNDEETYGFYCINCQQLVQELNAENRCFRCQQRLILQGQHQANDEDKGVKLGLGDFIFYSVLVGKVSSYGDWNITIACFIAILIGLCVTLLLLAMLKKALPALPISIAIGLIFYFTTTSVVKPFTDTLLEKQIFI